jgi:alkylated DNA repair dioxygenase AlkB
MPVNQLTLFSHSSSHPLPEGFAYHPDAISPDEESLLLAEIERLPFKEFQFHGFEGKRRVVSFGWRYDFSQHRALPADPIPTFLRETCRKIQTVSGFALPELEQVLVTEYAPGAPIGWHKDRPVFGDVMGLSLSSSCTFRLRTVIIRELCPQDLKIELAEISREEAIDTAYFLGAIVGKAHGRQMTLAQRNEWISGLKRKRQNSIDTPSCCGLALSILLPFMSVHTSTIARSTGAKMWLGNLLFDVSFPKLTAISRSLASLQLRTSSVVSVVGTTS